MSKKNYNYDEEMESDDFYRINEKAQKRKKTKRINIFKRIVLVMEIFISIALVGAITLLLIPNAKAKLLKTPFGKYIVRFVLDESSYDKVHDGKFNRDNVNHNAGLNTEKMNDYTTLALFGIDARGSEFDNITHSDSIIVVTINNKTSEVKMVSMYRDTYVRIVKPNGSITYDKLTNAYFFGGVEGAINTLNTNYDLNIKDYAIVNFSGLADVIDALGGIEVNLTKEEMNYVNGYLTETRKITGKDTPNLRKYGDNIHLTGLQAVAYCRIRYTAFYDDNGNAIRNDYGRTARQRNVINKLVGKAKEAGADKLLDIVDLIFKGQSTETTFRTSLSYETIIDMIPTLLGFEMVQEEGKGGFPYTYISTEINTSSVVCHRGLEYNVTKLHEYLYNDNDYKPTKMIQNIGNTLIKITGYEEKKLPEDEDN